MANHDFLGDPMLDRIMLALINIAEEVYLTQDRLNVIESLLNDHGVVTKADMENYQPSAIASGETKQLCQQFIARLLDSVVGVEPR